MTHPLSSILFIKWNEIWSFPMNRERKNGLPKADGCSREIGSSNLMAKIFSETAVGGALRAAKRENRACSDQRMFNRRPQDIIAIEPKSPAGYYVYTITVSGVVQGASPEENRFPELPWASYEPWQPNLSKSPSIDARQTKTFDSSQQHLPITVHGLLRRELVQ